MSPFLTPNNPPENQWVIRHIKLPADNRWTGVFDGHLLDLCYRHTWEQDGDMSPDDMAQWFTDHYAEFTTDYKETPNSETPGDLDGTPQYPWYEQLYDWIIEGFLAVTFTPNAAIVYQATVPKLRIAFRTNDIGALFRVLINGVEIWTGDSYGPVIDVIEQVFDTSSYETPYTVRIEHNGTGDHGFSEASKLEYIRQDVVSDMVQTILRADPAGCGIQWSLDDGGTWETIDLSTCITGLSNDAINQAIQDGLIATPGQQPSEGTPEPGQCVTYRVSLTGNNVWYCPSPVNSSDTITITNARGGWWDGDPLDQWKCPDGNAYAFGQCIEATETHEGDPINTVPHMALIGRVVNTYFDAIRDGYTVPSGVVNQPLTMQANDSELSDNAGSIEFDIEICASDLVFDWHYSWDLRIDVGGWTAGHGGWTEGVGFYAGQYGGNRYVDLSHFYYRDVTIVRAQIAGTFEAGHYSGNDAFYFSGYNAASPIIIQKSTAQMSATWGFNVLGEWTISGVAPWTRVFVNNDGNYGNATIISIELWGTGDDPFIQ